MPSDAAVPPPAAQMELFGLSGLSAKAPERVPIRVRSSDRTLSGWRLEVASDQGAGAIVLVDTEAKYYRGEQILLGWDPHRGYDFYQIRWSRPGRQETQVRTVRAWWALNNAHPGTPYDFKVQACDKPFAGRSRCTPWSATERVATR